MQSNDHDTTTDTDDRLDEYDALLDTLDIAMSEAVRKIEDGRIRDATKDQARCRYLDTLVKIVRERRQLLEARDLDEMSREIEAIKERQEWGVENR